MSVFPTVSCITLYLIPSKSTSLSAKKKKSTFSYQKSSGW